MVKKRATTGDDQLHLEVIDENDVGIDPHKKTLTASLLDRRGGTVATETLKVSGVGHRALEDWATGFGPVRAAGASREIVPSAAIPQVFLIERGHDVRDVCPTRTAEQVTAAATGQDRRLGLGAHRPRGPGRRGPPPCVQAGGRRRRAGRDDRADGLVAQGPAQPAEEPPAPVERG